MKKALIGAVVILGIAYIYGAWQTSSLIESMHQQCVQNTGNRAYCGCKRQVMDSEVNPLRYTVSPRKEGYRIVGVSSAQCVSKL